MLEPSLRDLVFLVSYFCLTMLSRTNRSIYLGTCMPSLRFWHCKILSQVWIILVRHQIHVPSSHIHLSRIPPWFYWTSNLNCIVHWTIFQVIGLIPWPWICYTCLLLHLEFLVFHLTHHICLWVPSMIRVHSWCTTSLSQKLCLLGWLSVNTNPCCLFQKYSGDVDYLLPIILWLLLTTLLDTLGLPCLLQFFCLPFPLIKNCCCHHWTWCIWWLLSSHISLTLCLAYSYLFFSYL